MTEGKHYYKRRHKEHNDRCRCKDCIAALRSRIKELYQGTDMMLTEIAREVGRESSVIRSHLKAMGLRT